MHERAQLDRANRRIAGGKSCWQRTVEPYARRGRMMPRDDARASTMEKPHQDLGENKGKLDSLIAMYTDDRKRLDAVEKRVWYGSGIAVVPAFLATELPFLTRQGVRRRKNPGFRFRLSPSLKLRRTELPTRRSLVRRRVTLRATADESLHPGYAC
jgi:hypothetical protein